MNREGYKKFQEQRDILLDFLRQTYKQLETLEKGDVEESVRRIGQAIERLLDSSFRVLVLGEFKRGKSTFINALLGEEVLPAFATPCTAVINEVKWSEQKKVMLLFQENIPEKLPSALKKEAREHIQQNGFKSVPPMEISVDDLEDYVTIQDTEKEVIESPFERAELFWPLELCKNGVEIIDSPGLNEHQTRTQVTKNYLSKADAILFVMSCQALCSQSEMAVVEELRREGRENIFFIANRFDQVREREKEKLKLHAEKKLKPQTNNHPSVHFLSAAEALDGRLDGNEELIQASGILDLEKSLQRFLVKDRGRIKLLLPAQEAMNVFRNVLDEDIPRLQQMLDQEHNELKHRYEKAKPRFDAQQRRRQDILGKLERKKSRLEREILLIAQTKIDQIANEMTSWPKDIVIESSLDFFSFSSKEQLETIAKEAGGKLQEKAKQEINDWRLSILQPTLKDHIEQMMESIENELHDFVVEIDAIASDISGFAPDQIEDDEKVSATERILSAAGGFLVGGVGSALVGGTMGYKEMLKSLLPNIGIGVVMIGILGITNPWILIPILLGAGTIQGILQTDKIKEKAVQKIAEGLQKKLREEKNKIAEEISEKSANTAEQLIQKIDQGLESEIESLQKQVESSLKKLESDGASIEQEKQRLKNASQSLQHLRASVSNFIIGVGMS